LAAALDVPTPAISEWRGELNHEHRVSVRTELRDLNVAVGAAEKENDIPFLRDVLHDDLVFRRADEGVVGKHEYLEPLESRTYAALETQVQ
jgi:hypothetical protein